MDNDRKSELEDKIREYRTQFEESMASMAAKDKEIQTTLASIAAYQERAVVEMAELRALHAEIAAEQKKTDEQMQKTDEQMRKTDEQQKKTDLKVRELNTNWDRFVESLVEGDLVRLLNLPGSRSIAPHAVWKRPICWTTARAATGSSISWWRTVRRWSWWRSRPR